MHPRAGRTAAAANGTDGGGWCEGLADELRSRAPHQAALPPRELLFQHLCHLGVSDQVQLHKDLPESLPGALLIGQRSVEVGLVRMP